jgi:hypothetical protein
MSIKLYSFIEQKTEKWQDEYRFKCADGTYKYVFDRGFLVKDEEGKCHPNDWSHSRCYQTKRRRTTT